MFTVQIQRPQRTFEATALAVITDGASAFIDQPKKNERPVFFTFVCGAGTFRPFTANIASGEPVHRLDEYHRPLSRCFEFPRSVPYRLLTQEVEWTDCDGEGGERTTKLVVGTYVLESAFELDPRNPFHEDASETVKANDPKPEDKDAKPEDKDAKPQPRPVRFYMMPAREDIEANTATLDVRAIMTHVFKMTGACTKYRGKLPLELTSPMLKHLPALALLWSAYVDRRINAPIIQEPEFIAQAFCAAADAGMVTQVSAPGVEALGHVPPWLCLTNDQQLRSLLAREIELYQQVKSYSLDTPSLLPESL